MAVDTWTRYQLRRQMFSIGEDFWIENERGEQVYKVDGKVLTIRETFVIEDRNGNELATVQAKLLSLAPTMTIQRGGQTLAVVSKELFTLFQQKFDIQTAGGTGFRAQGDILNHEYEIDGDAGAVAHISKRWFALTETYGVAIAPGQDEVLMLASAVCIDELSEEHRGNPMFGIGN